MLIRFNRSLSGLSPKLHGVARVKGYRSDKRPEQADTIETVREICSPQVYAGGLL